MPFHALCDSRSPKIASIKQENCKFLAVAPMPENNTMTDDDQLCSHTEQGTLRKIIIPTC